MPTHNKKQYSCSYCGETIGYDEVTKGLNSIWFCEKCGKVFCRHCFIEKLGKEKWQNMSMGFDLIVCPDCHDSYYGKEDK
jgi:ribosomal protein L37AE/L43A